VTTPDLGYAEHLAGNRYFDRKFNHEAVKVLPGEYFVTATNMLMVTVLGSCVSACILDREKGVGGMNHFMLADAGDGGMVSSSARYGTYAMEILINHLLKLGARKNRLEAKVFGAGRVMAMLSSSNVGERNAQFVRQFLHTEGIPVTAEDLLDVHPRKVYFFPGTGRVLVKKLVRMHNDTLVRRENEYAARLVEAPMSGDIELF
jgi:chemotaxis protein CheD